MELLAGFRSSRPQWASHNSATTPTLLFLLLIELSEFSRNMACWPRIPSPHFAVFTPDRRAGYHLTQDAALEIAALIGVVPRREGRHPRLDDRTT